MHFQVVIHKEINYITFETSGMVINGVEDIMEVISLCHENDTTRFLFYQNNFTGEFFDLKTGLAGEFMQKLATYFIRAVIIIDPDTIADKRFHELINESNRGNVVRFYTAKEEGVQWLIG